MSILAAIVVIFAVYFGIGYLSYFIVMYASYKYDWSSTDRDFAAPIALLLWPISLPIFLGSFLCRTLHNRARAMASKNKY
jgi:hypothetical protein